jgi:hypothetical protein
MSPSLLNVFLLKTRLSARGETLTDLLINFFDGLKAADDAEFV